MSSIPQSKATAVTHEWQLDSLAAARGSKAQVEGAVTGTKAPEPGAPEPGAPEPGEAAAGAPEPGEAAAPGAPEPGEAVAPAAPGEAAPASGAAPAAPEPGEAPVAPGAPEPGEATATAAPVAPEPGEAEAAVAAPGEPEAAPGAPGEAAPDKSTEFLVNDYKKHRTYRAYIEDKINKLTARLNDLHKAAPLPPPEDSKKEEAKTPHTTIQASSEALEDMFVTNYMLVILLNQEALSKPLKINYTNQFETIKAMIATYQLIIANNYNYYVIFIF
jgi:hypothetical protein